MTQECTPVGVLSAALSDPAVRAATVIGVSTPQSGDWWSAKKRKRTVACGSCDACCRNDCGTCLNCLDKPKFGGSGIRKQSCLERKCRNPMAAPTPAAPSHSSQLAQATVLASSVAKAAVVAPPAAQARSSMPPQEWEDFWSAVECCVLLQSGNGKPLPHVSVFDAERGAMAKGQRGRTNRCGMCAGCTRGDCGACKNCRDKPKFGGKGIKKQACVRRACNNPLPEGPGEEGEDDECDEPLAKTARVLASVDGEFISAEPSPSQQAAQAPKFLPPFALEGDGVSSPRGASQVKFAPGSKAARDGSCGMLQDTRRRLQQLRAANGAAAMAAVALDRPSSSMSTGYSTADEYEVDAAEPAEDDANGSEAQSATEDADEPAEIAAAPAVAAPLLVALAMASS